MPQGLLRVRGTIDVSQFWPVQNSDADTTKVIVQVEPDSFAYQRAPDEPFIPTQAFANAKVRSRIGSVPAVKDGKITVRLQGVDAPELHYRPPAERKKAEQTATQRALYLEWNHDYRQHLAETATVALATLLGGAGNVIACDVLSRVDSPNDVFDVYGRFVGDIAVTLDGTTVVVNEWLVEEGWGVPAFYASMTTDEIERLAALADGAYAGDRGIWPHYRDRVTASAFDWDCRYRRRGTPVAPAEDAGPVLLPKLFRRLAAYQVNERAEMITGTFLVYLKGKRADTVHRTEDFLEQGPAAAPVYHLAELFAANGQLLRWPEEIVFRDAPSTLVGPDGKTPTW